MLTAGSGQRRRAIHLFGDVARLRRDSSASSGCCCASKPARIASGAVILLTVLKVFLFDMAGLTGIWRALSFIGLGLVLMGIGYLYQRLLFPRRRAPAAAA